VSHLSVLDEETLEEELDEGQGNESIRIRPTVSGPLIDRVVAMLRHTLQMSLFGVDIVVEKGTGRYAIIDINAFPGNIYNWNFPLIIFYVFIDQIGEFQGLLSLMILFYSCNLGVFNKFVGRSMLTSIKRDLGSRKDRML